MTERVVTFKVDADMALARLDDHPDFRRALGDRLICALLMGSPEDARLAIYGIEVVESHAREGDGE